MRHEIKTRVPAAEAAALRVRLAAVMQRDKHALSDGTYEIHSVYFDTPTDRALMEKQVGVPARHKYRIRYYNDNLEHFRLECKSKIVTLCHKRGASLTREEVEKICRGNIDWMLHDRRELVRELYLRMKQELLRPRVQVHYVREAFVYGPANVRVTLDSDIRTGVYSPDFLNVQQPRPRTQSPDFVLIEVKYDEYLPEIIRMITNCQSRPMSFSKFEACHTYD